MKDIIVESYLEKLQEFDPLTMMAAVSILNLISTAYQTYLKNFTRVARRCVDLPDQEKALCMLNAKVDSKSEQLRLLKQANSKCFQAKEQSNKCKEKVLPAIQKVQDEINVYKGRIEVLKQQKYRGAV
jgi:hypothetical protein